MSILTAPYDMIVGILFAFIGMNGPPSDISKLNILAYVLAGFIYLLIIAGLVGLAWLIWFVYKKLTKIYKKNKE